MNSLKTSALSSRDEAPSLRAIDDRLGEATFPNLFIVGAQKSGTTSLHAALRSHPEIFMCEPKEPGYFIPPCERPSQVFGANRSEEDCLRIYLRLFRGSGAFRYVGEASTHYTMRPTFDSSAEMIHAVAPDARIIYIMRDPIERTISHYWWKCYQMEETRPPMQAVVEDERYRSFSHYSLQIRPYLELFSPENVFIATTEKFASQPHATLDRLFFWLGLKPSAGDTLDRRRENVTPEIIHRQNIPFIAALRRSSLLRSANRQIPPRLRQTLKDACRLALRPIGRKVVRSQVDMTELIAFLRPAQTRQVEDLSELLGRKFPEWRTLYGTSSSEP